MLVPVAVREFDEADARFDESPCEQTLPTEIGRTRGPRVRLSAETIRDNALAVSGLLQERIGGPSVKPYQPEGHWEDVSVERRAKYVPDAGEGLYRRSMYAFWKRTCPPPALMSFDATNREVCIVRRGRTNSPLQALVLLKDPTYVEAARKLAERVMADAAAIEDRVGLAFRIVLARTPESGKQQTLLTIYRQALDRFDADRQAAANCWPSAPRRITRPSTRPNWPLSR